MKKNSENLYRYTDKQIGTFSEVSIYLSEKEAENRNK